MVVVGAVVAVVFVVTVPVAGVVAVVAVVAAVISMPAVVVAPQMHFCGRSPEMNAALASCRTPSPVLDLSTHCCSPTSSTTHTWHLDDVPHLAAQSCHDQGVPVCKGASLAVVRPK